MTTYETTEYRQFESCYSFNLDCEVVISDTIEIMVWNIISKLEIEKSRDRGS